MKMSRVGWSQRRVEEPLGADRLADLLLVQPAFGVLPADVEPVRRGLFSRPGDRKERRGMGIERPKESMNLARW